MRKSAQPPDGTCLRLLGATLQRRRQRVGLPSTCDEASGQAFEKRRMLHMCVYPMLTWCSASRFWNRHFMVAMGRIRGQTGRVRACAVDRRSGPSERCHLQRGHSRHLVERLRSRSTQARQGASGVHLVPMGRSSAVPPQCQWPSRRPVANRCSKQGGMTTLGVHFCTVTPRSASAARMVDDR